MDEMMNNLLSTWDERPLPSLFVHAFSKYPPAPVLSLVDNPPPVGYGQISDLANFFAKCRFISDWGEGYSFPPSGFVDPLFNASGITKYVIHSWYPVFYDWVFQLDAERLVKMQHAVVGSAGIGKSSFGLYFMARLIASRKPTFCRHPFFVLSWRAPDSLDTFTIRVTLTGEVFRIGTAECERCRGANAFQLFDGHSDPGVTSGRPCLSILSPSEVRHWKIRPDIRYAPSLTVRQLKALSGVSRIYGLRAGDPEVAGFPASAYGTIESRMKLVDGNLRALFSGMNLETLKAQLMEGVSGP
jgi:hypothetical protein